MRNIFQLCIFRISWQDFLSNPASQILYNGPNYQQDFKGVRPRGKFFLTCYKKGKCASSSTISQKQKFKEFSKIHQPTVYSSASNSCGLMLIQAGSQVHTSNSQIKSFFSVNVDWKCTFHIWPLSVWQVQGRFFCHIRDTEVLRR